MQRRALGGLIPEAVQNGSERRFRSFCGRMRISLARSAAFLTGFERSARRSRWESDIVDAADLS